MEGQREYFKLCPSVIRRLKLDNFLFTFQVRLTPTRCICPEVSPCQGERKNLSLLGRILRSTQTDNETEKFPREIPRDKEFVFVMAAAPFPGNQFHDSSSIYAVQLRCSIQEEYGLRMRGRKVFLVSKLPL